MATPPIPAAIDPVEIALLRGGPGDVVRAVAIGMAERGIVGIRSDGLVRLAPSSVSREDPIENAIFDALEERLTFAQLSEKIYPTVMAALAGVEARLRSNGLVQSDARIASARRVAVLAVVVLIVAGIVEMTHVRGPHRVASLLFALATTAVGSVASWRFGRIGRTTDRGRRYLAQILVGFPAPSLLARVRDPAPVPAAPNGAFYAAPLLVGLYGLSELRETPYASAAVGLQSARRRPGDGGDAGGCGSCGWSSSGGCCSGGSHGGCGSGGCGSSGCGGGGCGSGGCGGGGCGG